MATATPTPDKPGKVEKVEKFLTRTEFVSWAQRFEDKLDRVIEKDGAAAIVIESRLTSLEQHQKRDATRAAWIASIFGSAIAGTIVGFIAWIRGH